jgi:hypothetical protein
VTLLQPKITKTKKTKKKNSRFKWQNIKIATTRKIARSDLKTGR